MATEEGTEKEKGGNRREVAANLNKGEGEGERQREMKGNKMGLEKEIEESVLQRNEDSL